VAACAGCVHGLVGAAATGARTGTGGVLDPALVVAAVAETLAWGGLATCCAWFAATVLAAARDLAGHPTRPAPRAVRGCLQPALVRSLLVVLVGGCVGSPGTPVATGSAPEPLGHDGRGWRVLEGLPLPGVPLGDATPARTRLLRVRAGDCLWGLTEDLLGPRATSAAVARAWPALHRLNRAVIGPDPDLLRPGTTLRVPARVAAPHQHLHQHLHQPLHQRRPGAAR
jgi:nucleoid-associated protein YgaU